MEEINGIKWDLLSHLRRTGEVKEKISGAEEDITALQQKAEQLEGTMEILSNKIQDQEDRGRRSNFRLFGLPGFLKWMMFPPQSQSLYDHIG